MGRSHSFIVSNNLVDPNFVAFRMSPPVAEIPHDDNSCGENSPNSWEPSFCKEPSLEAHKISPGSVSIRTLSQTKGAI